MIKTFTCSSKMNSVQNAVVYLSKWVPKESGDKLYKFINEHVDLYGPNVFCVADRPVNENIVSSSEKLSSGLAVYKLKV